MALDEILLSRVSSPDALPATYLRFYQWDRPTLSLGFSQKPERVVDFDFCHSHQIPIVRRLTGGKAVLHDRELTYAVISNDPLFFPSADISATYQRIAGALRRGFRYLNLEIDAADDPTAKAAASRPFSTACFAVANQHELLFRGRKLVGSAQRRTKTAFLQHGSILICFDVNLLAGALGLPEARIIESQVIDLHRCLGRIPRARNVISALVEGFREVFQAELRTEPLQSALLQKAESLGRSKYALLDWKFLPRNGLTLQGLDTINLGAKA